MTTLARPTLATDLDGTFAHGPVALRDRVVDALLGADDGALVYVTGRSVAALRALTATLGLPAPRVAITDVGTEIVDGRTGAPLPLADTLAPDWPGAAAVRARLADLPVLLDQRVEARRRVSYTFDDGADRVAATMEAIGRLDGLPVEVLLSADTYLDVLPRGVNKGSTLMALLAHLGRDLDSTVVAGDTLNDFSLFATGLRAIVVANAEPALKLRLAGRLNVHFARGEGIEGIAEGLARFGLGLGATG